MTATVVDEQCSSVGEVEPGSVEALRAAFETAEEDYRRAGAVEDAFRDAWRRTCEDTDAAWRRRCEAYQAWRQATHFQ